MFLRATLVALALALAAAPAVAADAPMMAVDVNATLGEGPFWSAKDKAVWFVDIKAKRVYRFTPATTELKHWETPDQVGWILPTADGRLMVGLKSGLHFFDPASGAFTLIANPEAALPGNRLNDAAVDPKGRLWFGSMDDAEAAATGLLHLYDKGRVRETGVPAVPITNGPAISPDGRFLYHVDTVAGNLIRYEIGADGAPTNPTPFAHIDPKDGYPDGPVVDSEGCVWIGLYFGWGVRRYAPDGKLLDFVRLPTANVTKIAFGGNDLKTVFVTTARKGLDEKALSAQPDAGDLFTFRVDVPGLPQPGIIIGD